MTSGLASESRHQVADFPAPAEDSESRLRRDGFVVGDWLVDPLAHTLTSVAGRAQDEALTKRIDPLLISVLVTLAASPQLVLTRDELLSRIWRDTYVNENSLSQAISRLRRALGDSHSDPRYIETVSRSGYRLIARVRAKSPETHEPPSSSAGKGQPEPSRPAPGGKGPRSFRNLWIGLFLAATMVALALAVMLWRASSDTQPDEASSSIATLVLRPEVSLPGNQFEPQLSPDGRDLVFAWKPAEGTNWDLWLQPIGGDQPVQLTDHPHDERLPTWSPDSRSLAFVRYSTSERDGSCGIFVVEVVSRRTERLGECQPGTRSLAWSPDSGRLIHDGLGEPTSSLPSDQHVADQGPRALFVVDLESGERKQLTSPPEESRGDTGVRLSPDEALVAFEREISASRSEIAVVDVATGETRLVAPGAWGRVRGLDWTSDGDALVVSSDHSGRYELWRAPLDSQDIRRLPVSDGWVTQPTVSRDGDRLVFRTFRDKVDIWAVTLDEAKAPVSEPLEVAESARSERQPAVSPNGDRIAFLSDRTGAIQLWSSTSGGEDLRRHTDFDKARPAAPTFAPDGKTIVFELEGAERTDIWTVDVDARQPRPLIEGPGNSRNPSLSRDGNFLYFASDRSGRWRVWKHALDAETPATAITEDGGFRALEAPGGDWIFYTRVAEAGLWRMPTTGGASDLVFADLGVDDWAGWSVSEPGVYLVRRSPASLWWTALDGSQSRKIAEAPLTIPYLEPSLSTSLDGHRLLVSLIEHGDDELLLLELKGL